MTLSWPHLLQHHLGKFSKYLALQLQSYLQLSKLQDLMLASDSCIPSRACITHMSLMRRMKNLFSFLKIIPIGVSWFVPVENVKSEPKKENLPKLHGPGICWFAPITNTKPWREPLREQNWQGQHVDGHRPLAGPDRERLRPFVRATLQVQWHWVISSHMFKGIRKGDAEMLNLWLGLLKNSHITLISCTSTVHLFPLSSLIKGHLPVNHCKLFLPSVPGDKARGGRMLGLVMLGL